MNLLRIILFLGLIFLAIIGNAQDFKVIEETKDYILKECDSAYYYTHGLPPKDDFVIDTTKIHKVNGVLKLPLDNGKEVVFRDIEAEHDYDNVDFNYGGYNKMAQSCLIIVDSYKGMFWKLINKKTGTIDSSIFEVRYSPNDKFCCLNNGISKDENFTYLKFINTKNLKEFMMTLKFDFAYNVDWIDDFNCAFQIDVRDKILHSLIQNKYYLVQIKH